MCVTLSSGVVHSVPRPFQCMMHSGTQSFLFLLVMHLGTQSFLFLRVMHSGTLLFIFLRVLIEFPLCCVFSEPDEGNSVPGPRPDIDPGWFHFPLIRVMVEENVGVYSFVVIVILQANAENDHA